MMNCLIFKFINKLLIIFFNCVLNIIHTITFIVQSITKETMRTIFTIITEFHMRTIIALT